MKKIEIFKGKRDWRFRVKANNGKIIAQSEGYVSKRNAYKGAIALTDCCRNCDIYPVK